MKRCHRLLRRVLECVVAFVLVVMSAVGTGAISLPVAHIALRPSSPAAAASAGQLASGPSAPRLPVEAWNAPAGSLGPLYGPYVPGTGAKRKPGEQPDLRTQTSETFLNPDGTWTLKDYGAPIHYKDAKGAWQPIDTTLIADRSDAGYAFGNKANDWRVHFASQAGGPHLVHAQFPGVTVAETLAGADTAPATTNGSTVVYAGVFPGVDLQYTVGSISLEETLLLQDAQAPASFTFTYHIPGASASQDAAGNVIFTDAQGAVLLVIGGVLMYEADAAGQMAPNAAIAPQVALTLSGSGPDFQITYTPDQTWLSDPARHFPVAIDPTWRGGDSGQNTTNGNIYADTYDASSDASTNYWNGVSLRIGNCTASGFGSGTNRSYLKFPINPAPAGVRVTSADLALFQSSQFSGGTGVAVTAGVIPGSWNATTLTWNNRPTGSVAIATANTATTQDNWVHWDVTPAVYEWWQAGVALNGFEMRYANETNACQEFFSDNNSNNSDTPILTINYVQDTTAPGGGLAFNGGVTSTNNPAVTVAPAGTDAGSIQGWSSNWTSVNGVGSQPAGHTSATWNVDGTDSELIADTSSCGSTACTAETFFSHTLNINNWPTFTAMFKADNLADINFGVISGDNASTRFDLTNYPNGGAAFTSLEFATTSGVISTVGVNIPFNANTWYYGQIDFPLPTIGEIFIWPVGQARPSTPSAYYTGIYMTNPGLNFFMHGDNGANLGHFWIGNVQMTSKDTSSGTTGYGIYAMQLSSDGTTYGCPSYASVAPFSGGPWCVYSGQSFPWTFSTGDGKKTLYYKFIDNAGNVTSGSSQIVLDTAPPTVNTITLANGNPAQDSEVRGVVQLAVNATDPPASDGSSAGVGSAVLYVDGVQAGTGVTGTSTPTFSLDTTNLSQGVHVLTASATDKAGNTGAIGGSTKIIVSNTALMPYETLAKRALPDGQTEVSVNVANGDAVVTHQDLSVPERGQSLALLRTYHSLGALSGLFGQGWTSDLDEGLTINGDGSLTYRDTFGGIHVFLPNGSGGFLTSPGLYLTLVQNGDSSYTLKARDQSQTNFNVAGLLSSLVDRNGNTLTIAYNGLLPTTVTDVSGRQYTITITGGHVTQLNAPGGRTYNYAYDGTGNLTDYTDPSGVVTHYDYDGGHRLTKITLNYVNGGAQDQQTNVATTLTYDTNSADLAYNRLVGLTDPMGYVVNISYSMNSSALQTQVAQQQGVSPATYETTTYLITTDGLGAVAKLTDALNNATQYQYDANENVTQVTDPDGHVTTGTHDSNGNLLTQVVDPGSSGHLNLTTTYTYDSANNALTETDPRGIITQYTYDSPTTGNVVKQIQNYVNNGPTNSDTNVTTTYTYDSYGEVLTATDPLGIVTQYTYDTQGDVLTTIANYQNGAQADSQTNVETSATYNALGERLTAINPLGIVTQYSYDLLGHLTQTIANYKNGVTPDSQTNVKTQESYDPLGRQVTQTNPLGIVTLTTYDKDGRVVSTTADYVNGAQPDNQTNVVVSQATYDAAGNTLTATDAKGNVTTTSYDLDNRAVQVTSKDSGGTILSNSKTVYDAARFTMETDTLSLDGNNTVLTKETFTSDSAGREMTQTDPPAQSGNCGVLCTSNVTTTTYDADGNATDSKETNAALASPGIVTESTATFDHLNRPLSKTEQANTSSAQTSSFTYDLDGRQLTMTDPSNQTTNQTYDALGRTLTVTHPDTTVDTSTYDAAGERQSECNSAGITTDTYDALSRVIYEERDTFTGTCANPTLTFQASVNYTYDAQGNKLTQLTNFPGGNSSSYTWTYDKLNRPLTMSDGSRSYTYDSNGFITQMTVGTAVEADMTPDGENRISTLKDIVGGNTSNPLHSYSYQYDAFGNRSQITTDGTATTYTYDNLQQLTKVQQGSTTLASYTYDANGNRATMVTSAGTTTYTYDSADVMLKTKKDPTGKVTNYTYDTNGNLTKAVYDPTGANQTTTYTYDTNNRLTSITEPNGTTITFAYDADGNRIQKKVTSGGTTTTLNDVYALGHLAYQTDGSGTILATFTYDTSGMPTSVTLGSGSGAPRYYYVYDGQGNVVAMTDSNGTVVASYAYDAFGALTSSSESFPNGWSNPYRYDGSEGVRYDPETGLYWMSVRAYDPALGRFLSHDPLGRLAAEGQDTQPYVYAGNNPVNRTDPSGMMIIGDGGDGGGSGPPAPPGDPNPPVEYNPFVYARLVALVTAFKFFAAAGAYEVAALAVQHGLTILLGGAVSLIHALAKWLPGWADYIVGWVVDQILVHTLLNGLRHIAQRLAQVRTSLLFLGGLFWLQSAWSNEKFGGITFLAFMVGAFYGLSRLRRALNELSGAVSDVINGIPGPGIIKDGIRKVLGLGNRIFGRQYSLYEGWVNTAIREQYRALF